MDVQNFWNERFGQEQYIYGTQPNTFLAESTQHITPGGRVLCIAEGEGRNALFLLQQGFDVSAVDLSTEGKKKAEKLAEDHGFSLPYTICDLNEFDFGTNRWDAVVSIFAHIDSASRKNVYPKVWNSLKEKGVFLLESYHPKQLEYGTGGPKDEDCLISLEKLQPHFAGTESLHAAELERDVTEGTYHTGHAYVTQLICRKSTS